MKIAIITPFPKKPLHPRTEMIAELFTSEGYKVKIIEGEKNRLNKFTSLLSLNFFDFSCLTLKNQLTEYDLIYIQDLRYLPLVRALRKIKSKVYYETLDNNVYLNFYHLSTKFPILKSFTFIRLFLKSVELYIAKKYAQNTIVNSKALLEYFKNNARLIYYSSPLESITINSPSINKKAAFVYLGWFTKMKGAELIFNKVNETSIKTFIIGNIKDKKYIDQINSNPLIEHFDKVESKKLSAILSSLMKDYFLIGLSTTLPVNKSNETQEINKDIDYLSIGIPILGNDRVPTREKIEAGCGIHFNDNSGLSDLISNQTLMHEMSKKCIEYYHQNYSKSTFKKRLFEAIKLTHEN